MIPTSSVWAVVGQDLATAIEEVRPQVAAHLSAGMTLPETRFIEALPDPAILGAFEHVMPGSAEQVMVCAERYQVERQRSRP
jgi:Predicted membrane protein (DUF2335)